MSLATTTTRSAWRRIVDTPLLNSLAAPHGIGRYLEVINPMWSLDNTRIPARITNITRETDDSVSIELSPNGEWTHFQAGQFIQVHVEINGRQQNRCYSLSRSAYAPKPRITVKDHDGGFISHHLNTQLKVGDRIAISLAQGNFVLPAQIPSALLFIAAGSGITPIMAMIDTLLEHKRDSAITLLYYSRNRENCIFKERLEELAQRHPHFSLLMVYSQNDSTAEHGLQGHFNQQHILKALSLNPALAEQTKALSLPLSYVCGPEQLINAVQSEYELLGHKDKVLSERFKAATAAQHRGEVVGNITFNTSQSNVANDGRNLLEQAEDAGLNPQSGCRMGICHTCSCLKTSGSVRNINTGEISQGEEHIRLCISQALGDVSLSL